MFSVRTFMFLAVGEQMHIELIQLNMIGLPNSNYCIKKYIKKTTGGIKGSVS